MKQKSRTKKTIFFIVLLSSYTFSAHAFFDYFFFTLWARFRPVTVSELTSHTDIQKTDIHDKFDSLKTVANNNTTQTKLAQDALKQDIVDNTTSSQEREKTAKKALEKVSAQQKKTTAAIDVNGKKIEKLNVSAADLQSRCYEQTSRIATIFALAQGFSGSIRETFSNLLQRVQQNQQTQEALINEHMNQRNAELSSLKESLEAVLLQAKNTQHQSELFKHDVQVMEEKSIERDKATELLKKQLHSMRRTQRHIYKLRQQRNEVRAQQQSIVSQQTPAITQQ